MKRTPLKRKTPLRARRAVRATPSPMGSDRLPTPWYSAGGQRLRSRISQPNARELRWREAVRSLGSIINCSANVEIHHCAGRTARHEGVAIGHYWILPLTREQHQVPDGIHAHPRRKEREKELFERLLTLCRSQNRNRGADIELPPPEVIDAIRRYRR